MTGITIRDALISDIPAITAIENGAFSSPWPEKLLRDFIEYDDRLCLIADIGNEPAGYLNALFAVDEYHIGSLAVKPEFRRRGVGAALVRELIKRAHAANGMYIFLEARQSNTAARELYSGLGFIEVSKRRNYYESPREDAILMTLYL